MKRHARSIKSLVVVATLALLTTAQAVTNTLAHTYPSDAQAAAKIARELYETLDPKLQKNLNPDAMAMEELAAPVITPVQIDRQNSPSQVVVSTGFIDLLNHIAHAKAIDRIQPGFFQQYVLNLARQDENAPVEAPNIVNARYWKDDVMNDQVSFFNQMVGMTVGISLSHHYLGHYNKYASQMLAGKLTPINKFITPAEWDSSIRAATLNSLDCALGTDGLKALFDLVDQLPRRPAWTDYLVPQGVNLKRLNQQLSEYETDYFRGGLKLAARPPIVSIASHKNGIN